MKKFKFNLDTVLNFNRSIEKEENLNLQKEILNLKHQTDRLFEKKRQAAEVKESIMKAENSGVQAQELVFWGAYLNSVSSEMDELNGLIKLSQQRVKESRDRLIKKMIARKSLEHLRERRFSDFKDETGRKNQSEADERALTTVYFGSGGSVSN